MGCENNSAECVTECNNIIYQSGDTPLNFTLKNCDGSPFNISSATEVEVLFPTPINPPVIFKLSLAQVTVTNGGAGQFSCVMSKANALLLTQGVIGVEVRVTIAGVITVIEILNQLTVQPSLFPGY